VKPSKFFHKSFIIRHKPTRDSSYDLVFTEQGTIPPYRWHWLKGAQSMVTVPEDEQVNQTGDRKLEKLSSGILCLYGI
jgi:hypothetical protein